MMMFGGCASPIIATADKDVAAKDFVPPHNKASLYIYRDENFGMLYGMAITVNGKGIGETGAKSYFRLNLPAGTYTVGSHAENYTDTQVAMEAGKNYFVWQEVKFGIWLPRSELRQVDEKTGKAGVLGSRLITPLISDEDIVGVNSSPDVKATQIVVRDGTSASQKLKDLQNMLKDNLITDSDYQKKKQQILDGM